MTITTITPRTRSIRFAWTNDTENVYTDSGASYLRIRTPRDFSPALTPRRFLEEYRKVAALNSGNDWTIVVTIGGKRMLDPGARDLAREVASMLNSPAGYRVGVQVEVEE